MTEAGKQSINPLKHPDFFQVHNLFTVQDLFDAGVQWGHKEGSMDERMRPYVFGKRLGHLVIDLDQTAELLREALNFTAHVAFRDGIILLISRSPQSTYFVDKAAIECGEYSYTRKWRGGIFTNSEKEFGAMTRLPDLCILFSTFNEVLKDHPAIVNSAKMCIPTVSIVDTNSNPNLVTYPVPGNDDSVSAIKLYCKLFKEAILRGKEARKRLLNVE